MRYPTILALLPPRALAQLMTRHRQAQLVTVARTPEPPLARNLILRRTFSHGPHLSHVDPLR